MSEINHFKIVVLYSNDVAADVDHLHVKKSLNRFLLYSYGGFSVLLWVTMHFFCVCITGK
jgi:hypothetical protein